MKIKGKKQIDASKTIKPKELTAIKDNKSDDNEKLLKYKEIFDELSNESTGVIYSRSKQIDFNNQTYYFKDKNVSPINFISFKKVQRIFIII